MSDEKVDVVVAFYSCNTNMPAEADACNKVINELWSGDRAAQKPVIIQAKGVGEIGADFVTPAREAIQKTGSYLKSVVGPRLGGKQQGRVALIGFSAGCSGVKTVLANKVDADAVDFVYACDGAHGDYGAGSGVTNLDEPKDEEGHIQAIQYSSIAPWVDFAVEAIQPNENGIPKRCMVITHTRILPGGGGRAQVASTRLTAARILREAQQQASAIASPCIVPSGLVGYDTGRIFRPESGCWSSMWNQCRNADGAGSCKSNICGEWPVDSSTILGNLIVVGFDAKEDNAASCGSACSQPAHIFQAWWVQAQVWREVLAPRWEFMCEHEVIPYGEEETLIPEDVTEEGRQLLVGAPQKAVVSSASKVAPGTVIRRDLSRMRPVYVPRVVRGMNGLGAIQLEKCNADGVFADMFSPEELAKFRQDKQLKYAAMVGGAAVLLALAWRWSR